MVVTARSSDGFAGFAGRANDVRCWNNKSACPRPETLLRNLAEEFWGHSNDYSNGAVPRNRRDVL